MGIYQPDLFRILQIVVRLSIQRANSEMDRVEELIVDDTEKLEKLKSVDFLSFFAVETLIKLSRSCDVRNLHAGQILFEEGDESDSMYIILSGELLVYKKDKEIARRVAGDYIGEMGLIESKPRSASIRSEKETQLLQITEKKFYEEFSHNSDALLALLKTLSERARTDLDVIEGEHSKLKKEKSHAEYLSRILDDTTNEIYIVDAKTYKVLKFNAVAARNLGYTKRQLNEKALYDIWEDLSHLELDVIAEPLLAGSKLIQLFEALQMKKDGAVYPVQAKLKLIEVDGRNALLAIVRDLTAYRKLESKIKRMAFFDSLTGLPNRNMINDRLALALAHAERNNDKFAVLFLDMDDFKSVNDTLGHSVGDELLKEVAKRLKGLLRSEDTVSRLGGDEFVILSPGLKDENYSIRLAERIIQALKTVFKIDEHEIYTSFSIGIAIYPTDGENAEALFESADSAMYQAKKQGKNSYFIHDPKVLSVAQTRSNLKSLLARAIEENTFLLNYQPRVDLQTGKCQSIEVFLRMNDPEKGMLLPGEFLPVAEESGLVVPIGDWVMQAVCQQLKAWREEGLTLMPVSINLSRVQLLQDSLVGNVVKTINKFELEPDLFEFEVSESTLLKSSDKIQESLMGLHRIGSRLTLDNFGMVSSLNTLSHVPFDTINIDSRLVQNSTSGNNAIIAKTIISIAENMQMKSVGIGVETYEQKEFLLDCGCDWAQGYLFGKPCSPDSLLAIMKTLSDRARDNLKIFQSPDSTRDRSSKEEKLEEHVKYLMQEAGLTVREADVARLVCDGLTDKQIAAKLGLSHHTVKDYLKKIYSKFKVHARSQLVALMFK